MKKWTLKIECKTPNEYSSFGNKDSMEFKFENLEDCTCLVEKIQKHGVGEFTYHFTPTKEEGAEEC